MEKDRVRRCDSCENLFQPEDMKIQSYKEGARYFCNSCARLQSGFDLLLMVSIFVVASFVVFLLIGSGK